MQTHDIFDIARASGYPVSAFVFVQGGLEFTVRRIHGEIDPDTLDLQDETGERSTRHVSGQQLCKGLRDFATQEYGLMARSMLARWNIKSSEDFGRIVFAMVDAGLMHKTKNDQINDFVGAIDFSEAFRPNITLTEKTKKPRASGGTVGL